MDLHALLATVTDKDVTMDTTELESVLALKDIMEPIVLNNKSAVETDTSTMESPEMEPACALMDTGELPALKDQLFALLTPSLTTPMELASVTLDIMDLTALTNVTVVEVLAMTETPEPENVIALLEPTLHLAESTALELVAVDPLESVMMETTELDHANVDLDIMDLTALVFAAVHQLFTLQLKSRSSDVMMEQVELEFVFVFIRVHL